MSGLFVAYILLLCQRYFGQLAFCVLNVPRGVGVTDLGLSPKKTGTFSLSLPYYIISKTNCSGTKLGNSRSLGNNKTKQRMDEHCKHNTNT